MVEKFDDSVIHIGGKFAASVVDIGGNFAAGDVDTGGPPWLANISANFREKKFETVLMEYSGAGGKLIHEKNQKQKISWHCPFKNECLTGSGS